jgi:putative membrane protein
MADMPWRSLRALAKGGLRRRTELTVEGLDCVPERGPVLLAARHVHHLWDGAALIATLPRPAHIIVGLDWIGSAPLRATLPPLCRAAGWPVVYRPSSPTAPPDNVVRAALLSATKDVLNLLGRGRIVIVFPEAYPNIDPEYTPKPDRDAFLPFEPGVVRLAGLAARRGLSVPIVPVGFAYREAEGWQITMRFGAPRYVRSRLDEATILPLLEADVRALST